MKSIQTGIAGTKKLAPIIVLIEIQNTLFVWKVSSARPMHKKVAVAESFTISKYLWYLFNITPANIEVHTPIMITQQPSNEISVVLKPTGVNN